MFFLVMHCRVTRKNMPLRTTPLQISWCLPMTTSLNGPLPVGPPSWGNAPLQSRDVPMWPGGPGQCPVLQEALTVQQLPHGQVSQLLHEFEGLADIKEHGEEELLVPGVHTDALGEEKGGVLL